MRKRYKIPLILLIVILVLPVGLLAVLTRTNILRDLLVARINSAIPEGVPLTLAVGELGGSYTHDLTCSPVVLVHANHPEDTIIQVEQMSLTYQFEDLWRGVWRLRRAELQGLTINLPTDSTIKGWVGKTKSRPAAGFDLTIDTLRIVEGGIAAVDHPRLNLVNLQLEAGLRHLSRRWVIADLQTEFDLPRFGLTPLKLSAAGAGTGAEWTIDSLRLTTPESEISLSGSVGPVGRLTIVADPLALGELSELLETKLTGLVRYRGVISFDSTKYVRGAGQLSGTIRNREIEDLTVNFVYHEGKVELPQLRGTALGAAFAGRGYFDFTARPERYGYTGRVDHFNLNNVAFKTFESDLSGQIELHGEGLTNRKMFLMFDCGLDAGRFDNYTFDSAQGRLTVSTTITTFAEDFSLTYKNTSVQLSGYLEYRDSMDIFANVYFNDLRDFAGQTFVDSLHGRGYAFCNLTGQTKSPDLTGQFESDSLRVFDLRTAQFFARYSVPHVFDQRGGMAQLSWGPAIGWSLPVDSLDAYLRFSGTEVLIDSARINFPAVSLHSAGWLDWATDTIPVRLDNFRGVFENSPFSAGNPINFVLDSRGFNFAHFQLEGDLGRLQAQGRVDYDTKLQAQLAIDQFHFAPYWARLLPDVPVTGVARMTAELAGDFEQPIISAVGEITALTYDGNFIGDFVCDLDYRDQRLMVDSLALNHPEWQLTGSGFFPLDLSFTETSRRILDTTQDFQLSGRGESLVPVVWFLPEVLEEVRGPWELSLHLAGTPKQPRLGGGGRLTRGMIKTTELQDPLVNLGVGLEFHDDTVKIIQASGQMGDDGTVNVRGSIQVEELNLYNYNLRLSGREIPARFEFVEQTVKADVDLSITGSSPPLVKGSILVLKGEDLEPVATEEEFELPDTTAWDWDIALIGLGNYWIRNDQTNAELTFDLRLIRERGIVSLLGIAELVPGRSKVYVFDRTGRIEKGDLLFDQTSTTDPELDLEISFRIPRTGDGNPELGSTQAEYARDVDLNLFVSGRASEPLIRAAEGSPYSDQDILLLLAANRPATLDTSASETDIYLDRIKFAATGLLFSQLERTMARAMGLETISLKAGTSAEETELTVGTYFMRNFYVYGSSAVALDRGQEVGFEYRIHRGLYLDGRRDKDNLYRLNLHLNWEY